MNFFSFFSILAPQEYLLNSGPLKVIFLVLPLSWAREAPASSTHRVSQAFA